MEVSDWMLFGLSVTGFVVSGIVGYVIYRLVKSAEIGCFGWLIVYAAIMMMTLFYAGEGLDTQEAEIQSSVEGIVHEKVVLKESPGRNANKLADGEYVYLGETKKYEVAVKKLEIQSILAGDEVVYRNIGKEKEERVGD